MKKPETMAALGTPRKKKRAKKGSRIVATLTAADGAVKVDVKERQDGRGWLYYAEYQHPSKGRQRPSLQTDDLKEAKERAREIADELALLSGVGSEEELARVAQSQVDLGQVFDEFRAERLPHFVDADGVPSRHWINLDRTIRVAERLWGRDQVVCEMGGSHVDNFKKRRAEGGFEIRARVLPDQFDRLIVEPAPVSLERCGPRTIRGELLLASLIMNWATKHPVKGGKGRKLIAANPLKGHSFKAGTENPRQPVMSDGRYEVMVKHAPEVEAITRGEIEYQRRLRDGRVVWQRNPRGRRGRRFKRMPKGYLVTLLMLARGTGRRIESLIGLRVGHILLTERQVRRKLLELGWPEEWSESWPYGAIYWDPDLDKEGYSRVAPISKRLHDQLRSYLAELGTIAPTSLLFHAPSSRSKMLHHQQVWRWFRRIEKIARYHGEDLLPLRWGAWHPFRRQWRSERAGYFHDKLVALVGGWKRFENAHEAMQQGYLQYHPRALYLCAEFEPLRDAPKDGRIPGVEVVVHAPDVTNAAPAQVTLHSHTAGTGNVPNVSKPLAHKDSRGTP